MRVTRTRKRFGLPGLALVIVSSVGGTLLASRTAQKLEFLKGRTFTYHRTVSLFLLLLAHGTPPPFGDVFSSLERLADLRG